MLRNGVRYKLQMVNSATGLPVTDIINVIVVDSETHEVGDILTMIFQAPDVVISMIIELHRSLVRQGLSNPTNKISLFSP